MAGVMAGAKASRAWFESSDRRRSVPIGKTFGRGGNFRQSSEPLQRVGTKQARQIAAPNQWDLGACRSAAGLAAA